MRNNGRRADYIPVGMSAKKLETTWDERLQILALREKAGMTWNVGYSMDFQVIALRAIVATGAKNKIGNWRKARFELQNLPRKSIAGQGLMVRHQIATGPDIQSSLMREKSSDYGLLSLRISEHAIYNGKR